MSDIASVSTLTPVTTGPTDRPQAANTKDAARQFESLLIGFLLKTAREEGSSWMGGGDDAASSSAIGYAEEHLARALASTGGLGLANMITTGLEKKQT